MFKLLCRLKWDGLLPFARLVESTHKDLELNPHHEVIETERKMTLEVTDRQPGGREYSVLSSGP
jgi:hypothetical protein